MPNSCKAILPSISNVTSLSFYKVLRLFVQGFLSTMRITRLVAYVIHNGRSSTPNLPFPLIRVVVAEWLRRWTRNPLGSPRAGSNPADYEYLSFLSSHFFKTVHLFLFSGIKFNSHTGNCYSLRSTGCVVRIPDKLTFLFCFV